MKLARKPGSTSQIFQIVIQDSSSTTGAGLTGLTQATAGLTAYYHRDTDTTATAITLVTMTVGTFTSSGFKEVDATNQPGVYQFCPPNAALASGASSVIFVLKGATNMAQVPIEIDLDAQIDVTTWNGTAVPAPATAGVPDVNVKNINNVAAATPGAAGGILISGSNAGTTTFGALTVTGATTLTGNVAAAAGITITQSTANGVGLSIAGNGTGAGLSATGGATGAGCKFVGGATSGDGFDITTTSGDGFAITPTAGNAIVATANGTSKHGFVITGGTGGTSDGFKAVAGTGGVDVRGAITGNITGNLSGSAGSVTGAVGSVTGNVGGNVTGSVGSVTGAVGSVTGNVGGNVVGSVASVTGAVGSVTGNVGGNVVGSVASVTGNVGGNVTGSVASVTGAVGSVTGNVGGNVTGTVASVVGSVGGNVVGSVASVTGAVGSVTGNIGGTLASLAAGAKTDVENAVWNAALASHVTAATFGLALQIVRDGTAQAGGGTTITLDTGANAGTDFYKNDLLQITGGTGAGQAKFITAYNGSTKVATVNSAWVTNPDNTSVFVIRAFDSIPGATAPTAAQVATAIWTDLLAGSDFSTAGSIGALLKTYTAPDNADIVTSLADLVILLARTDPTTALAAVKTVTDKLATMLTASGSNSTYTADALKNAPAGGGGGSAGNGDTAVNQDTGGTDNLIATQNGQGLDGCAINAYVASEWAAAPTSAIVRAKAFTRSDGRWAGVMMLNSGITYTFVFNAAGYVVQTKNATV